MRHTAPLALPHSTPCNRMYCCTAVTACTASTICTAVPQGSAAYVGRDNAVFDVPKMGAITGFTAGLVWKSFETYSQFSFRNQCLVASDWIRTKLFGRDISRV